jgi:broad specificity phosphatase PhoE
MVKTVYFIRHGESTANVATDERIEKYPSRPHISPAGVKQRLARQQR